MGHQSPQYCASAINGGCATLAGSRAWSCNEGGVLRQVHETHPEATVIDTNNAEVNAPIPSINARVGFKIAWRNVDYQVTRDALMNGSIASAPARMSNEGDGRPIYQPLLRGQTRPGDGAAGVDDMLTQSDV